MIHRLPLLLPRLGDFEFPIAALNDADIVIILILVPLMDRLVYPCIKRSGCFQFGMLRKIGAGYFILALAMVVAGLVSSYDLSLVIISCE